MSLRAPRRLNLHEREDDCRPAAQGRAPGVDRARRARARLPALLHGPDRAEPGPARHQHGSRAEQRPASLDRRCLRVRARRLAHHDGHARRPDRPPPAAPDRRRRLRRGVGAGRPLDERRDADRRARPARARRGDARALDPLPDPQHVPRSPPAHGRDRGLDHELLGRRRDRPAAGRAAARVLLVGVGVPPGPAGDGADPPPGADTPAGVPGSRRGPPRSRQRGPLARGRAGGDLRAQADCPGRRRVAARARDGGRLRPRRHLRAQAEAARRPADRPAALPGARVQRVARHVPARNLRRVRRLPLHLPVPAARARPLAAPASGPCPPSAPSSSAPC